MKKLTLLFLIILSSKSISQTKNFIDLPYIETSARVDTLVIPDRIYLKIIISEKDTKNEKSVEELENLMEQKLKSLGIDTNKDLTLSDAASNFKKYFLKQTDVVKTKSYNLKVESAKMAGNVIAELETIDISNIRVTKTENTEYEKIKLLLKSKAVEKAKKQAEALLNPLNQKVGKAIYINDDLTLKYNAEEGQLNEVVVVGFSSRQKQEFKPIKAGEVAMYVCGPTVYDLSHIGHARSAVAFDVIYRYLKYRDFNVKYTRNYTDIDDKIINRANKDGIDWSEIAEKYIKAFDEDMAGLGVKLPDFRPKATETIKEMLDVIQTLINNGFAYVLDGDVYYSVRKFKDYGKLSGKNIEELEAGARVEVNERKDDPLDFALWKKSKPGEPWWDSPWGKGRPGWHIECSAMSRKFLGDTIDIHGGGKDLIFPHHENETAQSEAATGKPFVKYWLHNGFVNIEKEKMSKSLGNILTIRDVLNNYSFEAVRLFLISSHYRSPIDYSPDALKEAEVALERYYRTLDRMEKDWPDVVNAKVNEERKKQRIQRIINAMDDDFNTAYATGFIFEEVNTANRLMDSAKTLGTNELEEVLPVIKAVFKEAGSFLGVFHRKPEEYFAEKKGNLKISEEEIAKLVQDRNEAKKKKDFKKADEIRKILEEKGILLEDTPKGTVWRIKI